MRPFRHGLFRDPKVRKARFGNGLSSTKSPPPLPIDCQARQKIGSWSGLSDRQIRCKSNRSIPALRRRLEIDDVQKAPVGNRTPAWRMRSSTRGRAVVVLAYILDSVYLCYIFIFYIQYWERHRIYIEVEGRVYGLHPKSSMRWNAKCSDDAYTRYEKIDL